MWVVARRGVSPRRRVSRREMHTPIEQRHLAGFLIGHGKSVLESAIALSEFVSPPLFGLDALTTNGFATILTVERTRGRWAGGKIFIVVIAVIVATAGSPLWCDPCAGSGLRNGDGIEAMGSGDGGWVGNVGRGERTTAAPECTA
jgi:hypothetical protein